MSRKLDRINQKLFNAEMGLDKFGPDSPQGQSFKREAGRLRAQKAAILANSSQERGVHVPQRTGFFAAFVAWIRRLLGWG